MENYGKMFPEMELLKTNIIHRIFFEALLDHILL
jgi:hypothetical protein